MDNTDAADIHRPEDAVQRGRRRARMESRVTGSWSNCLAQGPRDKYIYPGPACSKRCLLLLINNILSPSPTRNITLRSITLVCH